MILSTSHNFIFVHVPKTAGTALTAALQPFGVSGTRTLFRRLLRRVPLVEMPERAYLRKHETAADIRRKLSPEVFERFHRFSVVRNPFDHAVSHYEYLKEFRNPKMAEAFAKMSFRDYLMFRTKPPGWGDRFFTVLPDQSHFLVGSDGRLLVNRIMRFETLAADFSMLAEDLGLGNIALAQVNKTKAKAAGRPFQAYFDPETIEIVRALYARDFQVLGYSADLPEEV